jgi:hypothetical protein
VLAVLEPRHSWLAGIAMALGAAALALGAVHKAAGPFTKPPPIEQVIQEKAKTLYDRMVEAVQGEAPAASRPPPPRKRDLDQIARGATAGLGALALALALAAYARRESIRASAAAAILGIAALPWQLGLGVVISMVFVAMTAISVTRTQGPSPPR